MTSVARTWKYLLPVLELAFPVRAAIALSGNFVLHPNEIMQYVEPPHRLVFGKGVIYWEFFCGARSWLHYAPAALICSACSFCAAAGSSCSSLPWRRWSPPSASSTR